MHSIFCLERIFYIYGIVVIFCLQLCGGSENNKKTRRYNKEEMKKQLINSIVNNDKIETEQLNENVKKTEKPEDAAAVTKQYEDIRTKKKKFIFIAFHQGKVFKRFMDKEKFIKLVKEFKVHNAI